MLLENILDVVVQLLAHTRTLRLCNFVVIGPVPSRWPYQFTERQFNHSCFLAVFYSQIFEF